MIPDLISYIDGYLHSVFVNKFDLVAAVGFIGQILFSARFITQWIASEKAGKSVVPLSFWLFSLGGGLVLLVYALYRQDPVFILGQSLGTFIYIRNLVLIARERQKAKL